MVGGLVGVVGEDFPQGHFVDIMGRWMVLAHVVHRPLLLGSAILPADALAWAEQARKFSLSEAEQYLAHLQ